MDSESEDFTFDLTERPENYFAGIRRDGSDIVMAERSDMDDETDDDTDDDNCLDLTATPQTLTGSSTTTNESPSSSNHSNTSPLFNATTRTAPTSRTNSPNPLDLLVEDGISEDALVAMGIDINEIRAQREIERRLQEEARQLEYAKQLQQQLDNGNQTNQTPTATASSSESTSATAWRDIGLGAPPTLPTMPTIPMPPATSTAAKSNGKSPMVPGHYLPNTFSDNTYNNSQHSNKKPRPNHPTPSFVGASSSNHAESSSSAAAGPSAPVFLIDSDDDDLVDLTNDSDIGLTKDKAIPLPDYDLIDSDDDQDDEADDDDQLISGDGASLEAIMHQMYQLQQRQEAQRRYGITMNPLSSMHLDHIPGRFDISHHMFTGNGNLFMDKKPSPYPPVPGPSSTVHGPQLSVVEAEEQLRQLLETIADEEPPPPESRTGTPDGLRINLMEHQKIGFQWMCKQEVSTNKGGLLSDDMGLGKTIQTLSIIVARRCTDAAPMPDMMTMAVQQKLKTRMERFKVKCTLVVCPVSLMEQWAQEIKSKAENVSVYIHHGTNILQDPYQIAGFDVVIMSYHKARHEFPEDSTRATSVLNPMIFHRVVLDEAHTIKNKATGVAKACYRIEATYRWCLTATPIQNKIDELYSLINFLRIQPYCDWTNFRDEIVTPLKSAHKRQEVMKKVQVIMKAIALRRSKKAEIDGRPILNLPERNVHFTHVDFPTDERQFYNFVDNKVQTDFNEYVDAGTVMQNYSSVLVLLLRLRQACLHPTLTTIDKPVLKNNEERQLENAKSLDQTVVDRLVSMKDELSGVECPICMDAADEPRIISGCGHILCRECLSSYVNTNSDYGGEKSCPQCRGELCLESTVPVAIFFKIHIPELAAVEKKEDPEIAERANQIRYESSKKIDTMLEILAKTREESNGRDKTIIFSQFTQMLDLMERPLKENGIKFGRYDGSMAVKTRTAMIETYRNDPSMEVLLVSTRCGSLGLNLTMANRVILMDVWWNPALENQAIDRVHRIGQTKDVEVHRLFINNTVEDRILELQKRKQLIADSALGEGGAEKLGRLGLQDMLYLFRGGRPPPMPTHAGPSSSSSAQ